MKLDKEQMIYIGVGLFALLVLMSSTRNIPLNEVATPNMKNFDSSKLPLALKPPQRLDDGAALPKNMAKRNLSFNFMGFKPRFDT